MPNIFSQTKSLVQKEKHYTDKILEKLMVIENDKLFVEMKFHSLLKKTFLNRNNITWLNGCFKINRNLDQLKLANLILNDSVGSGMTRSAFLQRV